MKAFQFKIQIIGVQKPPVWRKLLIPENITFDHFHQIIQTAFGWGDCHLYQFSEKGHTSDVVYMITDEEYEDESVKDSREILIKNVFTKEKQTFTYIYDFGDNWKHLITVEAVLKENVVKPLCVEGKGACPPEDCGGEQGYAHLLEILNDANHPDHIEMKEWLQLKKNDQWDVNAFDIDKINLELAEI